MYTIFLRLSLIRLRRETFFFKSLETLQCRFEVRQNNVSTDW